ncbi:hypothetical protein PCIT_a3918 [Pseudoalteromonas citrea]|uniref:Thioredoxin domain-containing protein n=3 Tax=Pseudoalteromonas citrea TaxID=43655 RepID=A0AAD4AGI1_9GAMM|nr:hypothetical protein PCIT_a3918 [Pseudoalteromonas citrea]
MTRFHYFLLCLFSLVLHLPTYAMTLPERGPVEIIFINLWDEYYTPTTIPDKEAGVTRIYLQPDINIDTQVVSQFVKSNPQFKGLKIDKNQRIALSLGVWKTPSKVFMFDGKAKRISYLGTDTENATVSHDGILTPLTANQSVKLTDIDGNSHVFGQKRSPQVLFFSDALCPFQHLPLCEQKIAANNQLVNITTLPVKTIIKPFYISMDDVRAYKTRFSLKHPVILDQKNQLFQKYQITSLPYWVVLNAQNEIIFRGAKPPKRL